MKSAASSRVKIQKKIKDSYCLQNLWVSVIFKRFDGLSCHPQYPNRKVRSKYLGWAIQLTSHAVNGKGEWKYKLERLAENFSRWGKNWKKTGKDSEEYSVEKSIFKRRYHQEKGVLKCPLKKKKRLPRNQIQFLPASLQINPHKYSSFIFKWIFP